MMSFFQEIHWLYFPTLFLLIDKKIATINKEIATPKNRMLLGIITFQDYTNKKYTKINTSNIIHHIQQIFVYELYQEY